MTLLQREALRYARGDHDIKPTYAVAHRLERKGWLVWGVHLSRKFNTDSRGWILTDQGWLELTKYEAANSATRSMGSSSEDLLLLYE